MCSYEGVKVIFLSTDNQLHLGLGKLRKQEKGTHKNLSSNDGQ